MLHAGISWCVGNRRSHPVGGCSGDLRGRQDNGIPPDATLRRRAAVASFAAGRHEAGPMTDEPSLPDGGRAPTTKS